MECPKCRKEMESGWLYLMIGLLCGAELRFSAGSEMPPRYWRFFRPKGDRILASDANNYLVDASRCKNCKLIILEYC